MFRILSRPTRVRAPAAAEHVRDPHLATVECFARQGVSLTRVSSSGWLVRARASQGQGLSVLGCVQEHGSDFESMELEGGFRWSTHRSLHLAVAHLLTHTRAGARIEDTRPRLDADPSEHVERPGAARA